MAIRLRNEASLEQSLVPELKLYHRQEINVAMRLAANDFEKKFGVHFSTFSYFPKDLFDQWHHSDLPKSTSAFDVTIASAKDPSILNDIRTLTEVANRADTRMEERRDYCDALLRIYRKFELGPQRFMTSPGVVYVGIEREGRLLADSLGCLPRERGLHPHAKRIPFEGGILVGLSDVTLGGAYEECVIIDGAIASGATIIAVMEKLRSKVSYFHVFSAHATLEGLRAISQYAASSRIKVVVVAGHASEGLNDHYYATLPEDSLKLIVGDLGDTISSVISSGRS
jgi:hypothetical protein